MASMQFPPGGWNQTINYLDTLILEYSSTYPKVDLRLYCETVQGTSSWLYWDLPGPLASKGTFNLHLDDYDLPKTLNSFPTDCHFDILNDSDTSTKVNGGGFLVTTANKAETTYARTATATFLAGASSISTLAPSGTPTASASSSSGTSRSATSTASASSTGTATGAGSDSTGLSSAAKVGLGVGIGLGGALLIVLGLLALMMYRKRKSRRTPTVQATAENAQYERAELLAAPGSNPNYPKYSELAVPAGGSPYYKGMKSSQYLDAATNHQPQWGSPQELPANMSHNVNGAHELPPEQRFELGP